MTPCDHTSVGILVKRTGRLLLIERRRPPFGYAPPAGHVDGRPSFHAAAAAELFEEVGLKAATLTLIAEGRRDNRCRRPGGSWHFWKIYRAVALGRVKPSRDEVKRASWCSKKELESLADRARRYKAGGIDEENWKQFPGLEPVWLDWLEIAGEISIG
jgi:ADP-ribose pyrophosphatase YjhB (NUDIX family)